MKWTHGSHKLRSSVVPEPEVLKPSLVFFPLCQKSRSGHGMYLCPEFNIHWRRVTKWCSAASLASAYIKYHGGIPPPPPPAHSISFSNRYAALWILRWNVPFFYDTLFSLWKTNKQSVAAQTRAFCRHFLSANKLSLSVQGKQLALFAANDKIPTFRAKSECHRTLIHPCVLGSFPGLRASLASRGDW